LSEEEAGPLRSAVDRLYSTVEKEDAYRMASFTDALRGLRATAR
jgi:hypothetical protein